MQEFSTASASAKDPAALAATLTEKSAQGWSVVGIVTTTTEVTAFLSREATASAAPATPSAATSSVAEPAGWAVAPESAASSTSSAPASMAPIGAATYQPTPSYQPAASATPAVPAGWYADPSGRFDLRYWDGGTWTEHVSRAGQQFTDAPTA
ncbi:MAG: DUF2510 domain-containing protein [Actinobacteria bacterium]|nr:DUF2510 domain-containing protein [Actinomycetota bacterium]